MPVTLVHHASPYASLAISSPVVDVKLTDDDRCALQQTVCMLQTLRPLTDSAAKGTEGWSSTKAGLSAETPGAN